MKPQGATQEILTTAKYKVGDKVKIRTDLTEETQYGTNNCTGPMIKLKGQEAKITHVYKIGHDVYEYCIDIDDGHWFWTVQMFEEREA